MVVSDLSGQQIKGYVLREQLGSGGFGAVYRAYQEDVQREVAIKIILPRYANQPDFIRRFEAEAQTIAQLEHPYIVPMHDYWRDPHGAYLVMRLLRGGSIRDVLRQHHTFDVERIAVLLGHIASALHHAHQQQVIHRDIKPDNILLDESGIAYLADFGIAKNLSQETNGANKEIVGSLDYFSPEQARSEPITPRTDIYSLGVVLYELLVGEHPFHELSSVERMYKHISDPLPEITSLDPDLNEAMNEIIQRATQKNPKDRYSDVLSLAREFAEAAQMTVSSSKSIYETLTSRELDILQLIADDLTNQEIAEKLVVEHSTIRWYIRQINKKLRVFSREELKRKVAELGWFEEKVATTDASPSQIALLWDEVENPYKGLRAFERGEAQEFFGREEFVEQLLWRMQEADPYQRFLAIVGPSGSGKSSVARAGLLPALVRNAIAGSDHWFCIDMIPGDSPFDALETALTRIAADQAMNLHEHLNRDERGLVRAADLILPKDKSELLLLIDQFEEVFTLVTYEGTRRRFLDLLLATVTAPHSRVRIVATLRADFYDRPLQYPKFGEMLRRRMETILPLTAQGIERAIVGPVERMGMVFEDGLVAQIVSETTYQAGALPLLQFALTALFDLRESHKLTHEAYQQIGGVGGALANRIEDIYRQLDTQAQEAVRQLFLRLVTLGEGVEDTRRRVPRSELVAVSNDADMMEDLIDFLAQERFLALDNDPATRAPMVEVAHEAILREWDRLRTWLNESRTDIRMQQRLAQQANEWLTHQHDDSYLVRGTRLQQFEDWQQQTNISLTPDETAFLQTSIDHNIQQQRREQERKEREAQLEKRSRTVLRALVAVFALAAMISIGFGAFSLNQQRIAEQSASESRSLALGFAAREAQLQEDPDLALALAIEANRIDEAPDSVNHILYDMAYAPQTRKVLEGHEAPIVSMAVNSDETLLATGSGNWIFSGSADTNENSIRMWNIESGELLATYNLFDSAVVGIVFSYDDESLFGITAAGIFTKLRISDGAILEQFRMNQYLDSIAISPDGQYLLIGGNRENDDGQWNTASIFLLDANTLKVLHEDSTNLWMALDTGFSRDGTLMWTTAAFPVANQETQEEMWSGVIVWDAETGEEVQRIQTWRVDVFDADISFDNRYIVVGTTDLAIKGTNTPVGVVSVYDLQSGELVRSHQVDALMVRSVQFSLNARYVLLAENRRLIVWDTQSQIVTMALDGHTDNIAHAIYLKDGSQVITISDDHTIHIWDMASGLQQRQFTTPYAQMVWGIAVHPNGQEIVASIGDQTLAQVFEDDDDRTRVGTYVWNYETGELNHEYVIASGETEISADGKYFITASPEENDEQVRYIPFFGTNLFDVETGEHIQSFPGPRIEARVDLLANQDAVIVNRSGADGYRFALYDFHTGNVIRIYDEVHSDEIMDFEPSPDGSQIISVGVDAQAIQWDIETGEVLRTYDMFDIPLRAVDYHPSGKIAAIGDQNGKIFIVDTSTGEVLKEILAFDNHILDVEYSPDGRLLAVGGAANTVRIYDTKSYELAVDYTAHPAGIWRLAFSPDGKYLFTGGQDGILRQLIVPNDTPQSVIEWAQQNRYVREFTCEERDTYRIDPLCESEISEEPAQ